MKTCFLFPGQGAQYVGMGKDFHSTSTAVRELFDAASEISKLDLSKIIFTGTEDELKRTNVAQVALAVVGSAAAICLREHGIRPDGAAGFSLGEWVALVETGFIDAPTMFRLVSGRGRLMEEAGNRSGGSGMAAVIGMAPEAITAALAAAGIDEAWIANLNAPGQSVISGTNSGLSKAEEALKAAGAKRVIRLKVSGAFHSPIMKYAYDGFRELLSDVEFANPKLPLFSNVTGGIVKTGAEAKKLASDQIVSPVRWLEEEKAILAEGYTLCLEAGPGTVLGGLWKGISDKVPCLPAGTLDAVASISL
ncbi:MAG: ACP S-malonyltransferase [Spirochaetes bacterium]|nr:ACP S-malonyltransferase [Spirochaetota bacterium]